MAATIVPITLIPDLDNAWSVAPGALVNVGQMAPLQNGAYGSVGINDIGWTLTGTDFVSGYLIRKVDGTQRLFLNRAANIDEYDSSGTRTNRGTGYSSTTNWSMCAQGNAVIACSIDNATQVSTGAGFAALGGGSPKAKCCASNRGFVMLANTDTSGDQVWWSALYNYASFTPSIATEAGNTRLLDAPGPITALIAYRDGFVAFKNNAIFIGEYVGPNYIWDWRILSNKIGCIGPNAVAECDGKLYFYGTNGFFEFDGTNLRNIGLPIAQSFLINVGYLSRPGMVGIQGTTVSLDKVFAVADEIDGVVTFKHSYQVPITFKYSDIYCHYNTRAQKWGGTTGNGSGDANQVVVRTSTNDLIDWFSAANSYRFLIVQTVSGTSTLQTVKYPTTSTGSGASITTGVIGDPAGSGQLLRVYWRTLPGTDSDTGITITSTGYKSENKLVTDGTATGNVNAEFDYSDINVSNRFRRIALTWTTGKTVILAGLGIELQKAGSPR